MNLRDFLRQREKELTEQIAEIHGKLALLETDLALFQEAKAVVNRPIKEFAAGGSACGDALAEYANSPASTALRQFLEHHETDLTAQISQLRGELTPLEGEIGEVRRAKAAIGAVGWKFDLALPGVVAATQQLGDAMAAAQLRARRAAEILAGQAGAASEAVKRLGFLPSPSPYANMTMKQLIVKVLSEHFHQGATTRQMLEFFRDAWGRDIERTNLSPQISRLYQEGVIGRATGRKEWYLMQNPKGAPAAYKPVVLRHSGEVNWVPEELERDEWIPIRTQYPVTPDPDDDEG